MIQPKELIQERYRQASSEIEEFRQNRWGSLQSMLGRFEAAFQVIDFSIVRSWLDVGCGTGRLFAEAPDFDGIKLCVGLDFTYELLKTASAKRQESQREYVLADLEYIPFRAHFDLVTCIGVIYCCGIDLRKVVSSLARATASGGQMVIISVNPQWQMFFEQSDLLIQGNAFPTHKAASRLMQQNGFKQIRILGLNPSRSELLPIIDGKAKEFLIVGRRAFA